MILSYKTRLEPNNKQAQKLKQFAGAARYAYNWAIAKEKEAYELGNGFIGGNLRLWSVTSNCGSFDETGHEEAEIKQKSITRS